jgi:DNA-binding MarR family transcriptional regulator
MTRQGARKLVEGLVQRGYARVARDATDARRFNVVLTASGAAYAEAIVATIRSMNREIAKNISRDDLEVALSVMQTFTRSFQERGA